MKKIILSLILIMILSFTPVYESYADAGTITIAGGSIGVAGLGAAGLAGLTGPVVVAVFCAAMACGMDIELTKQSEAAGMTKTQFIKNKIEEYCNEANITLGVFNEAILSGMEVLKDGRITISGKAAGQIKKFLNWLWNSNQVLQNTAVENPDSVNINNTSYPVSQNIDITTNAGKTIFRLQQNVAVCITNDGHEICFFNKENEITGRWGYGNSTSWNINSSSVRNGYTYYSARFSSISGELNGITIPSTALTTNAFLSSLDGTFDMGAAVHNDTFTGTRDNYDSQAGKMDWTDGFTTVINPGLTIPIPADQDVTVNVQDYLDAIQKVIDKLQDITIPAIDDADGIPTEIDIPDETVIDPTIEKEEDTDLPDPDDTTPVINEDDAPVGPAAVEPLKFDLRNIFPFCIPFDVRDMISMLSAEPEAPRYHVSWEIPWINENLEFTVDLSAFDNVAAICRKMELLLFVVGLAVVTRSMFIRS